MWNPKAGRFARSIMILVIAMSLILVFSSASFAEPSGAMPTANHHVHGQTAIAQVATASSPSGNLNPDPVDPIAPFPEEPMPLGYIWSG